MLTDHRYSKRAATPTQAVGLVALEIPGTDEEIVCMFPGTYTTEPPIRCSWCEHGIFGYGWVEDGYSYYHVILPPKKCTDRIHQGEDVGEWPSLRNRRKVRRHEEGNPPSNQKPRTTEGVR
jgi:hypothetical protein